MITATNKAVKEYGSSLTLRQIFYRLVSWGVIEKTQNQYKYLSRILVEARRSGLVNYSDIDDRTREPVGGDISLWEAKDWVSYFERSLESYADYLNRVRPPFWYGQKQCIEIFLEKDTLWDFVNEVVSDYNVRVWPLRGYSSETIKYEIAGELNHGDQPVNILFLGDHDPSGFDLERDIREVLTEVFGTEASYERLAVTKDLIEKLGLESHWASLNDSRYEGYVKKHKTERAWELESIDPARFRELIIEAVEGYIDKAGVETRERKERKLRKAVKAEIGDILEAINELIE